MPRGKASSYYVVQLVAQDGGRIKIGSIRGVPQTAETVISNFLTEALPLMKRFRAAERRRAHHKKGRTA